MTAPHTRQSEAERRTAFIAATIRCLDLYGYHGTTVRRIAAQAGVAPGLLTHYFQGKADLIAASYRHGAHLIRSHAHDAAANAGPDACQRFKAFVHASFAGPEFGADIFRVWLNFWTVTITETAVREAHAETYQDYRDDLASLIADMAPAHPAPLDTAALAIGVNALIDGLWLERGLDPDTFDAGQAARIVFHFTGAALGVDLNSNDQGIPE